MTKAKFLLIALISFAIFQGIAVVVYFIWGDKMFVRVSVAATVFLLMVWKQQKKDGEPT